MAWITQMRAALWLTLARSWCKTPSAMQSNCDLLVAFVKTPAQPLIPPTPSLRCHSRLHTRNQAPKTKPAAETLGLEHSCGTQKIILNSSEVSATGPSGLMPTRDLVTD